MSGVVEEVQESAAVAARLSMRGVSKHFGGVFALRDVDFTVGPGEIRGLIGRNGSGKSTLVKIASGFHYPDGGQVLLNGDPDAVGVGRGSGVAIVHQDLALVGTATVTENLGISSGFGRGAVGRVRWGHERRTARDLLTLFGAGFGPSSLVQDLSPGEQAIVAVIRAYRDAHAQESPGVLILDEPTAYLGGRESEKVLEVIAAVAATGAGVVFISHRLSEVREVADSYTVLKDGVVAASGSSSDLDDRAVSRAMFGDVTTTYPSWNRDQRREVSLTVTDLSGPRVDGVSLEVCGGDVVGLAGLAGMGQSEVLQILAGLQSRTSGTARWKDISLEGRSPRWLIDQGVVYVPGDRRTAGAWLEASASNNISLPVLAAHVERGVIDKKREARLSRRLMEVAGVVPAIPERLMQSFSGGNQQKIVLAKWLQMKPEIVLLDDPFQGVDIAARHGLLQTLFERVGEGAAVVFASSDYDELANVCSRVYVMRHGKITTMLAGERLSADALFTATHGSETAVENQYD